MSSKTVLLCFAGLLLVSLPTLVGCVHYPLPYQTVYGPNMAPFGPPIPLSPYFQKKLEDKTYEHERYERAPVLGPITSDGEVRALDPPSDDEVMRALEKAHPLEGGIPFLHTQQRDNVRITVEPVADYIDPPRVFPLVGPAQLHHAHYKCTVYYTHTTRVGWPIPYTNTDEDAQEVIYIDHDHMHMVGNVDGGPGAAF
jgi:hypothetical protein